jgi:hypothetical protein
MTDISHQQHTVKLNRSSGELIAVFKEAGLNPIYGQRFNIPIDRAKFQTVIRSRRASWGIAQRSPLKEIGCFLDRIED